MIEKLIDWAVLAFLITATVALGSVARMAIMMEDTNINAKCCDTCTCGEK